MTDPKLARATENGRHYIDPANPDGPMLPSVTNCIDHGSGLKTPGLVGWAAKVTAEYAWEVLPRMVYAARHPDLREELHREIKAQRTIVRDTASDLGSRIHHHAEAHLTGRTIEPDPEVEPYLAQYLQFLADFGVDLTGHVHSAEATVINRRVGYAGTLDILLQLALDGVTVDGKVQPLPDGQRALWLIDIKTSATKPDSACYPDQRLQLAGLRFAERLLLPDDSEIPMPKVAGCALLNLRIKSYGFIPVVANRPEFDAFCHTVGLTTWATSTGPDLKPITATGAPKRAPRKAAAKKTTTARKAA